MTLPCENSASSPEREFVVLENPSDSKKLPQSGSVSAILTIALWAGMAAGILEAAVLWGLEFKLAHWQILIRRLMVVDANIFWASPIVDVLFFSLLACLLLPVIWLFPKLHWPVLATGLFVTVGFYFSLTATGYFRERAAVSLAVGLGVVFSRWMKRDVRRGMRFLTRTLKPLAGLTALVCLAAFYGYGAREWVWVKALPEPPPNAPNVLFIVLDTARADRMGLYGYPRGTTPFLDSLAQESVVFDHAFASSSWTLPSHATFFTGRAPYEHRASSSTLVYDGKFPTLAQFLSSRGYRTAGFVANWMYATASHGMDHGFQRYENLFIHPLAALRRTMLGRKMEQHGGRRLQFAATADHMPAPDVNRRFLRWIDSRTDRPFFAFLNYMDLHSPLKPPDDLLQRFSTPEANGPDLSDSKLSEAAKEQAKFLTRAYDASYAYLDRELRNLFDEIRKRGLHRNLMVVITSDHGESLGEHSLFKHRNSLYIEQIRVPLILHFPERLPKGARVSGAVALADLPVTVASLMDAAAHPFPGAPLTNCLAEAACASNWVVAEVSGTEWSPLRPHDPTNQGWIRSIASSRWHFLLQQDGKTELYEWLTDTEERKNLAADAEWQDLVRELRTRLEALPPPAP
ncbi:MAG: sulfatase [Candidatus Acidiferrales bacterium]